MSHLERPLTHDDELIKQQALNKVSGLYVIIDPRFTLGRDLFDVSKAALSGGASALQFRNKILNEKDQKTTIYKLLKLVNDYNASLIINDDPTIASDTSSHGVHLGQKDLTIPEARKILKPSQLIGTSNAIIHEALSSERQKADYIAVGAIFRSNTKHDTRPAGIKTLVKIREGIANIPIIAIGGITINNVDLVLEAGADGICVISEVCSAIDPETAAYNLTKRIELHRKCTLNTQTNS